MAVNVAQLSAVLVATDSLIWQQLESGTQFGAKTTYLKAFDGVAEALK